MEIFRCIVCLAYRTRFAIVNYAVVIVGKLVRFVANGTSISLDWFPRGIYWEIRVWLPGLPRDLDFIVILM